MKRTLAILTLLLFTTIVSCRQPNVKKEYTFVNSDSLQVTLDKKERERLEDKKKIEEQYYADSFRLDKVLQDADLVRNMKFCLTVFRLV
jgi:hypothetical protein